LDKSPFESAHSIAETLPVVHQTVLLHFHDFIDFRLFRLHCVTHLFTGDSDAWANVHMTTYFSLSESTNDLADPKTWRGDVSPSILEKTFLTDND
jgi:hypothetical protein